MIAKNITRICDICKGAIDHHKDKEGEVYWTDGHNAEPLVENGRCCTKCNEDKVIPTRMLAMMGITNH